MGIRIFTTIFSYVLLSGCSFAPSYTISPDLEKSKLATVFVYRTKVDDDNLIPDRLFFYIDGEYFGMFGAGASKTIKVKPGTHTITMKESILFMATYENGRIQFNAEPNRNYYIRYSKNFSAMSIADSINFATGTSRLHWVNEENSRKKK